MNYLLTACLLQFLVSICTCCSSKGELILVLLNYFFHYIRYIIRSFTYIHGVDIKKIFILKEDQLAALLDRSLRHIILEPKLYRMSVDKLPKMDWQFNCTQVINNFNCRVYAEKLKLIVYKKVRLNKF